MSEQELTTRAAKTSATAKILDQAKAKSKVKNTTHKETMGSESDNLQEEFGDPNQILVSQEELENIMRDAHKAAAAEYKAQMEAVMEKNQDLVVRLEHMMSHTGARDRAFSDSAVIRSQANRITTTDLKFIIQSMPKFTEGCDTRKWIDKFRKKTLNLTADQQMKVLERSIDKASAAGRWLDAMEDDPQTGAWTVGEWLKAMDKRFAKPRAKVIQEAKDK